MCIPESRKKLGESLKMTFDDNDDLLKASPTNCPRCGSKNFFFLKQETQYFSFRKFLAGIFFAGELGVLLGLLGERNEIWWHCNNCGKNFKSS